MLKRLLIFLALVLVAAGVFAAVLFNGLKPADSAGSSRYFRVEKGESVANVLDRLQGLGVIKDAGMVRLHHRLLGEDAMLHRGTYEVSSSQSGDEVLKTLLYGEPVRQMVLIREGLWVSEVAATLEAKQVAAKDDVVALSADPSGIEGLPSFIVPGKGLEGYLYPETYDLPPLLGAEDAIRRMLLEFSEEVYEPLGEPDPVKLRSWVIVGSMIELEAKHEDERKRIAGVIYNRLNKGMPLQIDATVIYGLGLRRTLKNVDYQLDHPYNTYKLTALPPGPICSPRASSVFAAAEPEQHGFFYYVAMPDGRHRFARTYAEHLRNVSASRRARAEAGG